AYVKENLKEDGTVYVLGGEGAVDPSWLGDLEYTRLKGGDRYATNIAILKEAAVEGGDLFVCTGKNFADALSASALDTPILLVGKELNDDQKAFLDGKEWNFIIIGGDGAVSKDVEDGLSAYGTVSRIFGKDRYETSVLLAEAYAGHTRKIVLATGKNFPDGLCGGPVAYKLGAPIILTSDKNITAGREYTGNRSIHNGIVLGGTGVISDDTVLHTFRIDAEDLKTY
ncbi:MAG: cell wall-binding repeat-containing protein, partial [Erysipelotrichaceae bacterium]|nr:cell wall-binding repeat-containing protein [Erysipelotrichaceae bacterium]